MPKGAGRALLSVILGAVIHKQPTFLLKQLDNEEDGVKTENTKNILPFILDSITQQRNQQLIRMKSWRKR
ncbi:hypothetical protein CWI38_2009p0020 [Hamiltosporidium tvaerminnensis]|uniref:Uncharacterized protein n=1 Tax=Hamiltosporidium tvaerminnensis TaxID=1176355 RepID=A0A4Q9LPJ2_9MICR|nr:hypothetical protein CWI38_2009p0020 [Hamiltosporidium tvaerminnensis]